jgi:hypothetical protein
MYKTGSEEQILLGQGAAEAQQLLPFILSKSFRNNRQSSLQAATSPCLVIAARDTLFHIMILQDSSGTIMISTYVEVNLDENLSIPGLSGICGMLQAQQQPLEGWTAGLDSKLLQQSLQVSCLRRKCLRESES